MCKEVRTQIVDHHDPCIGEQRNIPMTEIKRDQVMNNKNALTEERHTSDPQRDPRRGDPLAAAGGTRARLNFSYAERGRRAKRRFLHVPGGGGGPGCPAPT